MDPQTPTVPTPPPQVTPPVVSPILPKKNNLAVILLSILLLITLFISGYLFLQVQGLTKQLAQLQIQPTSSIPTTTPDITANWKTYTDPKGKYSFKYPDYWKSQSLPTNSQQLLSLRSPTEINISLSLVENLPGIDLNCEVENKRENININKLIITKILTTGIKSDSCGDNSGSKTIWAVLGKNISDYLIIRYNIATTQMAESTFDQILSTFRFLDNGN